MISLRAMIRLAYSRAAAKLGAGETFVTCVPNSIEVARELREWLPNVRPDDALELATLNGIRLADSDPAPRPSLRPTLPPEPREWRTSSIPPAG